MESDYKFLIRVMEQVIKLSQQNGIESLSEPERVALLTWWARDLVGNGGFRYFYEGKLDILEVANAYDELGFPDAGQACRGSLLFFPPEVVARGGEAFSAWLVQLFAEVDEEEADDLLDSITDYFRPFDDIIWKLEPEGDFGTKLAEYRRTHASAFGDALETFPRTPRWPNRRASMS